MLNGAKRAGVRFARYCLCRAVQRDVDRLRPAVPGGANVVGNPVAAFQRLEPAFCELFRADEQALFMIAAGHRADHEAETRSDQCVMSPFKFPIFVFSFARRGFASASFWIDLI
jgi:hypothetical protein